MLDMLKVTGHSKCHDPDLRLQSPHLIDVSRLELKIEYNACAIIYGRNVLR